MAPQNRRMRRCLASQGASSTGTDYIPRLVQSVNEHCVVVGKRLVRTAEVIASCGHDETTLRARNKFTAETMELLDQFYYMHDILQTGDDELNIFLADNILFRLVLPLFTTLCNSPRVAPDLSRCSIVSDTQRCVGHHGSIGVPRIESTSKRNASSRFRDLSPTMCLYVVCQVFYIFGDRMLINAALHQVLSNDLARDSDEERRQRVELDWRAHTQHHRDYTNRAGPLLVQEKIGYPCEFWRRFGGDNNLRPEHPTCIVEWGSAARLPDMWGSSGLFSVLGALSSWYRHGGCGYFFMRGTILVA